MRRFSFIAMLVGTWLLLSGHYTLMLLSLGLLSIALVWWLTERMQLLDADSHPVWMLFSLMGFWLKLWGKIIQSNLTVVRCIFSRKEAVPALVEIPFPDAWQQNEELKRVIYANAITLTPGTATLDLNEKGLWVHCLQHADAEQLRQGDIFDIMPTDKKDKA